MTQSGIAALAERMKASVGSVVVGNENAIELALVAILCEGHILIEDVPGIGKTTLAKSLARSMDCTFQRIQFTPDLLPSDITGVSVFNQKNGEFEFRPGPVFCQVLLADEINRATPRAQAALLEVMEERQVTVDGQTMPVPRPFLVLATQNPIELEGTFPLPEAQVDRFMLRLDLGYPEEAEEHEIIARFRGRSPLDELQPAVQASQLLDLQQECRSVHVSNDLEGYAVQLVRATRGHPAIELGASPRATLALYRGAQALAALRGRDFVIPDDIKHLARYVIAHRIILDPQSHLRGRSRQAILDEVIASVPVPVEREEPLVRHEA